jgi:hypothetical protein
MMLQFHILQLSGFLNHVCRFVVGIIGQKFGPLEGQQAPVKKIRRSPTALINGQKT